MIGCHHEEALAHAQRALISELCTLGQEISSFLLRVVGADAEQAQPITAEEEWQLGRRLVESGRALQKHAEITAVTED